MTEQLTHTHSMGLMRAGHWTKIWQLFFFWLSHTTCGISVPRPQEWNLCPLHWKHGVLTTGPPEKSLRLGLDSVYCWKEAKGGNLLNRQEYSVWSQANKCSDFSCVAYAYGLWTSYTKPSLGLSFLICKLWQHHGLSPLLIRIISNSTRIRRFLVKERENQPYTM